MPVPRRRHSPSRRDRRRAHEKLDAVNGIVTCTNTLPNGQTCGSPRVAHRACPKCGEYKGRVYITQKKEKKPRQPRA